MRFPLIIAIDFDGTIADIDKFPNIARIRPGAKKYINKLYSQGHHIIIWTCRSDISLTDAIRFLNEQGVWFHSVNEHHEGLVRAFNNDTRKVAADVYVDDKGLWITESLPHWWLIYWMIKWKSWRIKEHKKLLQFCN
jgi:hypothetical protein